MTLSGSSSSLPYLEMSSASSASTPRGPGPPLSVTFAAQTVTFGGKQELVLTPDTKRRRRSKRKQRSLGIIQILSSIPLLITASIMIPTKAALYFLGSGFICAAFFSLAGFLSLYAAKSRSSGSITACCIISVIATIAACSGLALAGLGLAVDVSFNEPGECIHECTWLIFQIDQPSNKTEWFCRIAMHVANILTTTFAAVINLIQVIVTCTAVCYRKTQKDQGDPIIVFQPGSEHLKFRVPQFKVLQQIDDQSDNNSTQTNDSKTDVNGGISPVTDGTKYRRLTEV